MMQICNTLFIVSLVLHLGYTLTTPKSKQTTTAVRKLAKSQLNPVTTKNASSTTVTATAIKYAANFISDIVTYEEVSTSPPYLTHKKLRTTYTETIWRYFRNYGILNCRNAYCENLENGRKEFKKVSNTHGATITNCNGKTYFVPYKNISAGETWYQCCQYGMIPASFTSKEDCECFNEAYYKISGTAKNSNQRMLTAYMDTDMDSRYTSCYTMKSLPSNLWWTKEPNNLDWSEAVILYYLKDLAFLDINSKLKYNVVCESIPSSITTLPQKIDFRSFNSTNMNQKYSAFVAKKLWELHIPKCKSAFCNIQVEFSVNIPKSSSSIMSGQACRKNYVLVKTLVTYTTAWEECCKMGMVPLSVDSVKEMKYIKNLFYPDGLKDDVYHITSLLDENLDGSYMSCATGNLVPSALWAVDNPRTDQACVQLVLGAKKSTLVSSECNNKAFLLCEQKLETYEPSERQYHEEKNMSQCQYAVCNKSETTPTISPKLNLNIIGTQKTYHYHVNPTLMIKQVDAWSLCCASGLVPLSIDSIEEMVFLKKKIFKPKVIYYVFHTSIIDIEPINPVFASCITGKTMDSSNITLSGTNFAGACTYFSIYDDRFGLEKTSCLSAGVPICQTVANISEFYTKHNFPPPFEIGSAKEEPFSMEKRAKNSFYDSKSKKYFKENGFLNCTYAVCPEKLNGTSNIEKATISKEVMKISGCSVQTIFIILGQPIATWKQCCQYGMKPKTVQSMEEIQCITKEYQRQNGSTKFPYAHVANIDSIMDYRFKSCANGKTLPHNVWHEQETNKYFGREPCASIGFYGAGGMVDHACDFFIGNIICETIDSTKTEIPKACF